MKGKKKSTGSCGSRSAGGPYSGEVYTGLKVYRQKSTGKLRTHR